MPRACLKNPVVSQFAYGHKEYKALAIFFLYRKERHEPQWPQRIQSPCVPCEGFASFAILAFFGFQRNYLNTLQT